MRRHLPPEIQRLLCKCKRRCTLSPMADLLFAWLGATDLRAAEGDAAAGIGPIAQSVEARGFKQVVLLNNWPITRAAGYVRWLGGSTDVEIDLQDCELPSPTDFGAIYE